MRTGLAGLVALVWSIAAILIWNSVGGPPPAVACVPSPAAPSEGRLVSLVNDAGPARSRAVSPGMPCEP